MQAGINISAIQPQNKWKYPPSKLSALRKLYFLTGGSNELVVNDIAAPFESRLVTHAASAVLPVLMSLLDPCTTYIPNKHFGILVDDFTFTVIVHAQTTPSMHSYRSIAEAISALEGLGDY